VELLITRLAIACFTAVFGNAFSKWFLNTKAGAWFQRKLDTVMEWLQKRYNIEVAKKEVKWRRDYPLLAKRIDNLEAKIEGYEDWKKALDE
tara:strand:+ start:33 stop:305 length:273 start_codon:yes stop_codon:yes gene_type:complete